MECWTSWFADGKKDATWLILLVWLRNGTVEGLYWNPSQADLVPSRNFGARNHRFCACVRARPWHTDGLSWKVQAQSRTMRHLHRLSFTGDAMASVHLATSLCNVPVVV